jgi:hypothetical protein
MSMPPSARSRRLRPISSPTTLLDAHAGHQEQLDRDRGLDLPGGGDPRAVRHAGSAQQHVWQVQITMSFWAGR